MRNVVMIFIVIISLVSTIYGYSKIKVGNEKKEKKNLYAMIIGQLIPLFTLIFPMISPQEGTKILFPEMEKKIEENKKLKAEIKEKDKLISNFNLEEEKLNKKIKDLDEQNYADLKKANLILDGLKKENQVSVALVNDSTFLESKSIEDLLGKTVQYDELDNNLYVGGKGEKISKIALSDNYSMLYSGQNYKSKGNEDDRIEDDYTVAGKEFTDGFILTSSSVDESYVLIRLDDKYSSVEFDVGKADVSTGSRIKNGKLKIDLDSKEKYKDTVDAQIATQHFQYDVTGAKTLKISMSDTPSEFAFSNVIFNKK